MKFSQKELLEEGFWGNFKKPFKVARGLYHAGKAVASSIAPEITEPLSNAKHAVKGWGSAFKHGYHGITPPAEQKWENQNTAINPTVARSVAEKITMGLSNIGYQLIPKYGFEPHGVDPNNGNKLYKVAALDPRQNKRKWIVVDTKGNINS